MFVDQVPGTQTSYTIPDLLPATCYAIQLTAQCGLAEATRAESTPREIMSVCTSKTYVFMMG